MIVGNNIGINSGYQNNTSKADGCKNVREYSKYLYEGINSNGETVLAVSFLNMSNHRIGGVLWFIIQIFKKGN